MLWLTDNLILSGSYCEIFRYFYSSTVVLYKLFVLVVLKSLKEHPGLPACFTKSSLLSIKLLTLAWSTCSSSSSSKLLLSNCSRVIFFGLEGICLFPVGYFYPFICKPLPGMNLPFCLWGSFWGRAWLTNFIAFLSFLSSSWKGRLMPCPSKHVGVNQGTLVIIIPIVMPAIVIGVLPILCLYFFLLWLLLRVAIRPYGCGFFRVSGSYSSYK